MEADCKDLHDNARILLTTLGYPVFEKAGKYQTKEKDKELYCRRKGGVGRGLYTPEGLVVLKGSTGPREDAPSIRGTPLARRREQLITDGVFRVEGGLVVVTEDYVFSTPSAAAEVLLGRKANGWTVWKDAAGRTLDEIWRAGVKGTV